MSKETNTNDQIKSMMRLKDRIIRKWSLLSKDGGLIKQKNKYNSSYQTVYKDDFNSAMDDVLGCIISCFSDEISQLQKENNNKQYKTK